MKASLNGIDEDHEVSSSMFRDYAPVCLFTGYDQNSNPCSIASHLHGKLDIFRKPLGTQWEKSFSFHDGSRACTERCFLIAHIGPCYVAAASGLGISVYDTKLSNQLSMNVVADAAGCSPSRGSMAPLLIERSVEQLTPTLTELKKYVVVAS